MPKEYVVLLHGLARTRRSMRTLETAVLGVGYGVANQSYASTSYPIEQLASRAINSALAHCPDNARIHFVTHSMGGLLASRYLAKYRGPFSDHLLGRVVMLAPPHGGSEIADLLHGYGLYRWFYGPAGQELITAAREAPESPYYELGIIAGTSGWLYPVANRIIGGAHDGRVSVVRTKVPGMREHLSIATTHTLIPWRPAVLRQIASFLKTGAFERLK